MFERTSQSLLAPRSRSLRALPLAAGAHLALIAALAALSFLVVEAIPEDLIRIPGITEIHVVEPPPPLGEPDGGGSRPAPERAPRPEPPDGETLQPLEIPDPAPPEEPDGPLPEFPPGPEGPGEGSGAPFGDPDGVEGGLGRPGAPRLPGLESDPADLDPPVEVTRSIRPPRLVVKVQPVYPPLARRAGVQGTVRLRAVIGRDGRVEDLEVASGPALLVEAARDAVSRWVYEPALQGGRPVRVWFEAVVTFQLE